MSTPASKTVVYKTVNNVEIALEVYLPQDSKNVPVVLRFHGGGLLQGHRSNNSPHTLQAVEKYKIALISADYRLAPQVGISDIFEDVKDSVAFIRNELPKHLEPDQVDVSKLAVMGSSAGGYLALLAGLYVEPKPNVILPIYPITDPLGLFFTNSQSHPMGTIDRESLKPFIDPNGEVMANTSDDSKRNKMYFYMMEEANLATLLRIKPGDDTYRVAKQIYERRLPPTYVVHGDADTFVGVEQADEVVGAMLGCGLEVQYERLRGEDHLFDRHESVTLEKMYEFMMKHL